MLSIFSVPKPFVANVGIIQRNAIRSWARLHRNVEVVLCGDEPGTEEMAAEVDAKYVPQVVRNEYGTPLLNSVFEQAERASKTRVMCYANADIILMNDFLAAIQRIAFAKFLMVGQRWDIDITEAWNFEHPDSERQLRSLVAIRGRLHPPLGSDYFVFPKNSGLSTLPPFVVGRPKWDNWFIYHARRQGVPVIDATRVTTVVHQNHGYDHVPSRREDRWEGPEADWNRGLVGGWDHVYNLNDATHVLTPSWLMPTSLLKVKRAIRTGVNRCRRSASLPLRAYRRVRQRLI